MKKVNKSPNPPMDLINYLGNNPSHKWEDFRNNCRAGYDALKVQLISDQRGLCAYCEIDLKPGYGVGLDDFRVDHFHPKTPHIPPRFNSDGHLPAFFTCIRWYLGPAAEAQLQLINYNG